MVRATRSSTIVSSTVVTRTDGDAILRCTRRTNAANVWTAVASCTHDDEILMTPRERIDLLRHATVNCIPGLTAPRIRMNACTGAVRRSKEIQHITVWYVQAVALQSRDSTFVFADCLEVKSRTGRHTAEMIMWRWQIALTRCVATTDGTTHDVCTVPVVVAYIYWVDNVVKHREAMHRVNGVAKIGMQSARIASVESGVGDRNQFVATIERTGRTAERVRWRRVVDSVVHSKRLAFELHVDGTTTLCTLSRPRHSSFAINVAYDVVIEQSTRDMCVSGVVRK